MNWVKYLGYGANLFAAGENAIEATLMQVSYGNLTMGRGGEQEAIAVSTKGKCRNTDGVRMYFTCVVTVIHAKIIVVIGLCLMCKAGNTCVCEQIHDDHTAKAGAVGNDVLVRRAG